MIIEPVVLMLAFSVYINLLLAIFNMIPLPPLDGGRVLWRSASPSPGRRPVAHRALRMVLIIVLVFFTNIFSYVLLPLLNIGAHLLAGPQSDLGPGDSPAVDALILPSPLL